MNVTFVVTSSYKLIIAVWKKVCKNVFVFVSVSNHHEC